jgi:alkylation response protein AidB-like acyl-CoA dehydrogenase
MDFAWSSADVEFRMQLRSFLETQLPDRWDRTASSLGSAVHSEVSREITHELGARSMLAPHWPLEHGGKDAGAWQHIILGEEMWRLGEPRGPHYMAINWAGPAIMMYGTDEQKQYFLPAMVQGDIYWCQGFSEPDAGTDLASLRTKAVREGDDYVINGQKIWTSYANGADYCFLLARTDQSSEPHAGISVFLVPMTSPGVDVRRIDGLVGAHSFFEVFFTDVAVPAALRLGEENRGWEIVTTTLAHERLGVPRYARSAEILSELWRIALEQGRHDDEVLVEHMAEAHGACEAARILGYRVIDGRTKHLAPSHTSYMARAAMVAAERLVAEVGVELLEMAALEEGAVAETVYRNSLGAGLAAGSYEVQLMLVARALFGT